MPGFSDEEFKAAVMRGLSSLAEVCGILPQYVDTARSAMVVIAVGRIDGPSGTLAWSELPCGPVGQLNQKYDSSERWVVHFNGPPPSGKIDIVRVIAHELGHALGLAHGPSGNLMAPTYSSFISRPQSWDISQLRERYGPPIAVSPPIPQPPAPTPSQPGGPIMPKGILFLLRLLLPYLEAYVKQSPSKIDDLVLEILKGLLAKASTVEEQSQLGALQEIKEKLLRE